GGGAEAVRSSWGGGGAADCVIGGVFASTVCGVGGAVTVTAVVDVGAVVVVVGVATGGVTVRVRDAIAPTIPAASRIAPSASHSHRPGFGRGGATATGAAALSIIVGALVML